VEEYCAVDLWEIIVVGVVVAAGAWVQGGAGFGAALVAAPIVALVEPRLVPGPMIIGLGSLTLLMVIRERHHVELGQLGWALAGRVPGTVIGALAIASLPQAGIDIGFGLLILTLIAGSVWGVRVAITPGSLAVTGTISGISGTATSVGGPPMALLLQHQPGGSLRANLSALFTVGIMLSVAGLVAVGEFGRADLGAGALLCIPAVAGFSASRHAVRILDSGYTRHAVLVISGLSSFSVLIRGIVTL
jgi:uncharacterized protein